MYQRGMSLIQLVITLSIVATTAQFASPAYHMLTEQQRRQTTAEQLASSLRKARSEALIRHQYVVVHAREGDWSKGWRMVLDVSGQGHADKNNPVLAETHNSRLIPITGNSPVKHYVRFNPLGEPLLNAGSFQAGTLHVCQTKEELSHYQVVLAKSGRISLRNQKAAQALCAMA